MTTDGYRWLPMTTDNNRFLLMTTDDYRWLSKTLLKDYQKDYPMTLQWLSDDYPMTLRWLSDDYPMTTRWLSNDYPMTIQWLSNEYPMTIPWLYDDYPMTITNFWSIFLDDHETEDDCLNPVLHSSLKILAQKFWQFWPTLVIFGANLLTFLAYLLEGVVYQSWQISGVARTQYWIGIWNS